ncbi:MAG: trehalase family glycosidase [bacterium]
MTEHGLATEALKSPYYESDSYWRGPIWAPSTYLIVDGLRRGGNYDLALKIARGFCNMIKNNAGGNYENFDAVTGKGLRAPGYTWTASVHMLLLTEFISKEET